MCAKSLMPYPQRPARRNTRLAMLLVRSGVDTALEIMRKLKNSYVRVKPYCSGLLRHFRKYCELFEMLEVAFS
jgi:hypothetical protein